MCGRICTKGSRRMLLGLALAAVAALGTAGSASATSLSYTFGSGNQGWRQNQDPATLNGLGPAGFDPMGGNPGGHLTATDMGPETGCPGKDPCQLLTFYSPFVPTLGANYGGTGSFDLRSEDVEPEFGAELLLLPSGHNYLDGVISEDLGMSFNHLSISLTETANWKICPYAGGTCTPPSQAEFKSLIGTADEIAVMADVAGLNTDGTGETYDLDNVTLTEPAPPASPGPGPGPSSSPSPGPSPSPPAKHKKKCKKKHKKHRKHKKHHRAAAAKTKKKCKKKRKHRRAAVARFRG